MRGYQVSPHFCICKFRTEVFCNIYSSVIQGIMELREKEGDDAFHPSIEYFLGNVITVILFVPES